MGKKEKLSYVTDSPSRTKKLGFLLAKAILESGLGKKATVLALSGDLGAGKTHFAKGVARGLGVKGAVNSPTFVIFKKYPLKNAAGFKNFYHIDCYRLDRARDLAALGIEEILNNPETIAAVEWPEAGKMRPGKDVLEIKIELLDKNKRKISF